jgi:molybdopterin molybdotransferase
MKNNTNDCLSPNDRLLTYDEALGQLLEQAICLSKPVDQPLMLALGNILSEDIYSEISVPPQDVSSMDGYALNTKVSKAGQSISISQRIPAGHEAQPLEAGTAARIFTGASIPPGANCVVMQERVTLVGSDILLDAIPGQGTNIRPAGNDIKIDDRILTAGSRLRAQDIGIAASIGRQHLPVYEPIKVGMFFTGDELVEPGQIAGPGKIYDSNRYTLFGLLTALGCEIVDLGLVGDTLEATKQAMLEAADKADLVITSGGVSVGEEDHVRIAIENLGDLMMWRLGIKPGKPLAYGKIQGTHFIGLPGNPVSVFATFCLFVSPLLKTLQGRQWQKPIAVPVKAGFDWPKPDSRREFLRARLEQNDQGDVVATIYANQDSGVLTSTVWADGFVEVPEQTTISCGDWVDYLPFSKFLDRNA